jgi:dynein heavy chain 2
LDLRTIHRQLTRLLSHKEQEELRTNDTFKPFLGLNPINYNPYTEPLWRAAVKQFEHSLLVTEERIAGKLKVQLQTVNANTLQVFMFLSGYWIFPPLYFKVCFFVFKCKRQF